MSKKIYGIASKVITTLARIIYGLWVVSLGIGVMTCSLIFFPNVTEWAYSGYLSTIGVMQFLYRLIPVWFVLSLLIIGMIITVKGKNIIIPEQKKREEVT